MVKTEKIKILFRHSPHMFRHTSLSLLDSAGWDPELLRIRARHKNIYTALNTYVHPSYEEKTESQAVYPLHPCQRCSNLAWLTLLYGMGIVWLEYYYRCKIKKVSL